MKSNSDQPLFDNLKCIRKNFESNPENLEKYLQILKLASVGEMMGEISHTFNNILGGILGYSQLLKEQLQAGSDALRQAQVIEKASKRAAKLISQMQFFTQKQTYQKRIVDPKQIVTEVTLILESTFTSLGDVAAFHYPLLLGRHLMHNRFDSIDKIGNYKGPLLMSHGDADHLAFLERLVGHLAEQQPGREGGHRQDRRTREHLAERFGELAIGDGRRGNHIHGSG